MPTVVTINVQSILFPKDPGEKYQARKIAKSGQDGIINPGFTTIFHHQLEGCGNNIGIGSIYGGAWPGPEDFAQHITLRLEWCIFSSNYFLFRGPQQLGAWTDSQYPAPALKILTEMCNY